ncbi:hypothetical protein ACHHYP_00017, partial [Achlya hypogyna]
MSQLVNGTLSANTSSCPAGHYCPLGTYQPTPCPVGTYLGTRGGQQVADCVLCVPGQFCNATGATAPSGPCDPGYFCQFNNVVARPTSATVVNGTTLGGGICPVARYCPSGSSAPLVCSPGTYSISTGASQCTPCPPGYYCPSGTSDYTVYPCPAGYYCPQGTTTVNQYPCPKGTYSNQTGLTAVSQCVYAPGGQYVDVVGATAP